MFIPERIFIDLNVSVLLKAGKNVVTTKALNEVRVRPILLK